MALFIAVAFLILFPNLCRAVAGMAVGGALVLLIGFGGLFLFLFTVGLIS